MKKHMTHEQYIHAVRDIAAARLTDQAEREKLLALKLTYGGGDRGARGVTFFNAWRAGDHAIDFVAVNATAQESTVQIAGTVIHELGHVLAGAGHGHDKTWREQCAKLGLRCARMGARYSWVVFEPEVRAALVELGEPGDGKPAFGVRTEQTAQTRVIQCSHGVGSRGGRSRGEGSGSRMLKCVCTQCGYTARVARSWLAKGAPICPTDTQPLTY